MSGDGFSMCIILVGDLEGSPQPPIAMAPPGLEPKGWAQPGLSSARIRAWSCISQKPRPANHYACHHKALS